jgi:membrane protein
MTLPPAFQKILDTPAAQYFLRLYNNIQDDYIGLLAAGIAFYFFLAAFPAIGAAIALYGLFADPAFIADQFDTLSRFLPPESLHILQDQARSIVNSSETALSLTLVLGILLTIYSATKGSQALIKGLNIAFNVRDRRNFLVLGVNAFILTFVMLAYIIFALSLIAFMPALFTLLHFPDSISTPLLLLRWPLLFLSAMVGIQIIYNYAPVKKDRHRIFTWGAFFATLIWLGGSSFFSAFVSNFGNYNETYGSLGAVAVLLLWFWLTAIAILTGAEINASVTPRGQP